MPLNRLPAGAAAVTPTSSQTLGGGVSSYGRYYDGVSDLDGQAEFPARLGGPRFRSDGDGRRHVGPVRVAARWRRKRGFRALRRFRAGDRARTAMKPRARRFGEMRRPFGRPGPVRNGAAPEDFPDPAAPRSRCVRRRSGRGPDGVAGPCGRAVPAGDRIRAGMPGAGARCYTSLIRAMIRPP